MSALRRASLALLSLNVNDLGQKIKKLTLFSSLMTDSSDGILPQETHHGSEKQTLQWTKEGAGKEKPWLGTSFWLEGTSASRGVAVLFNDKPDLAGMTEATPETVRGTGRILRVDFQ